MELQGIQNSQNNLEKEQRWITHTLISKLTAKLQWSKQWFWLTDKHMDQRNRKDSPEINPHRFGQKISNKGAETIQWEKDSLFNKWYWENWISTCNRTKSELYLTSCAKVNSKCTKDFSAQKKKERTKASQPFVNNGLYSQARVYSSSHVRMWHLDQKEGWVLKNCAFKLWSWRRLLRVPWTARRSNLSILKEISPEYSLEGLTLKLKL